MKVTSPFAVPGSLAMKPALLRDLNSTATQVLSPCVITPEGRFAWVLPGKLSGRAVRILMRRNRYSIRGLAHKMDVTMKRVREVRAGGVEGWFRCGEWLFAITGGWFIATNLEGYQL